MLWEGRKGGTGHRKTNVSFLALSFRIISARTVLVKFREIAMVRPMMNSGLRARGTPATATQHPLVSQDSNQIAQ